MSNPGNDAFLNWAIRKDGYIQVSDGQGELCADLCGKLYMVCGFSTPSESPNCFPKGRCLALYRLCREATELINQYKDDTDHAFSDQLLRFWCSIQEILVLVETFEEFGETNEEVLAIIYKRSIEAYTKVCLLLQDGYRSVS